MEGIFKILSQSGLFSGFTYNIDFMTDANS